MHVRPILLGVACWASVSANASAMNPDLMVCLAYDGLEEQRACCEEFGIVQDDCKLSSSDQAKAGAFTIDLISTRATKNGVAVEIGTNIPGSVDVMVSLGLEGQASNDVFIGASKRVSIRDGRAAATVGKEGLPSGTYELALSYYPKWGPQDAAAKAAGADSKIELRRSVVLEGSGGSSANAQFKENGQRWVMEHINVGAKWAMSTWTDRFGEAAQIPVTGLNPKVVKAYYFKQIDMTIFVNEVRGEISHWRVGRQSR